MGLFGFLHKNKKEALPPVPPPPVGDVPATPPPVDDASTISEHSDISFSQEEQMTHSPLGDTPTPPPPEGDIEIPKDKLQTTQVGENMHDDLGGLPTKSIEPLPTMEFPDLPDELPDELPDLELPSENIEEEKISTEIQDEVQSPENTQEESIEEVIEQEQPIEEPEIEPVVHSEEGPLFVSYTTFNNITDAITTGLDTMNRAEGNVIKIKGIHDNILKEEEKWRKSLDQIQKKLLYLDGMLFER